MIIYGEIFQDLVLRIIKDIGNNVNIIDMSGMIIASGNQNRIGTYHQIGHECAQYGKRIDVEEDFEGVKKGVNQPFYHKGKMIGVIGITGEPSKIEDLVKIVKSMIELLYEQEVLKQRMQFRQSNKVFFLNEILNVHHDTDVKALINWGDKLGYDLACLRCVILLDLKPDNNSKYSQQRDEILKNLKLLEFHMKNDISSYISYHRICIIKDCSNQHSNNIKIYLDEIGKLMQNEYNIDYNIAVGSIYENIIDFKQSMKEAEFILNQEQIKNVVYIEEVLSLYLFSKMPTKLAEHFFKKDATMVIEDVSLKETLLMLTKTMFNVSLCAKQLYVHRNTVIQRVNKINKLLCKDILNSSSDQEYATLLACYLKRFKN